MILYCALWCYPYFGPQFACMWVAAVMYMVMHTVCWSPCNLDQHHQGINALVLWFLIVFHDHFCCYIYHQCQVDKYSSNCCFLSGCLLSSLELMQAVDQFQYYEAIQATFSKLLMVDSYRSGYYQDLSECVIVFSSPPVIYTLTVVSCSRVVLLARHFLYRFSLPFFYICRTMGRCGLRLDAVPSWLSNLFLNLSVIFMA